MGGFITLAAIGIALATALFAAFQTWRLHYLLGTARRVAASATESRAGLRFVAEGRARPLDPQFAGALLDGNDLALRQRFPTWSAFRDFERERDIDMEFETDG